MRCPDCNKFVSYDTDAEPEEEGEATIEGSSFNATYTRTLPCSECGTDLKSASIDIEGTVTIAAGDIELGDDPEVCPGDGDGSHDWDVTADASATTETQTGKWKQATRDSKRKRKARVSRGGKEIETTTVKKGDLVWEAWGYRYHRTSYGVEVEVNATCEHCKATASGTFSDSVAASGMDEQV
jgi:hypothetical protein